MNENGKAAPSNVTLRQPRDLLEMLRRLTIVPQQPNVCHRAPYAHVNVNLLVDNGCGFDSATPIRQAFDRAAEYGKDVGDPAAS